MKRVEIHEFVLAHKLVFNKIDSGLGRERKRERARKKERKMETEGKRIHREQRSGSVA